MRVLSISLVMLLAAEAGAVEFTSLVREVTYWGGLQEPRMIADSRLSTEPGPFSEQIADTLSSPPDVETAAAASQFSYVGTDAGGLAINVNADVSARAITLADGTLSDAFAKSRLAIVFTTHETTQLTVDIAISSSLGNFFDGTGSGAVVASHISSFLLCAVGGGCLADIFAEDITDNLQAVAKGIQDSIEIPPGSYEVELLAISQAVSRDDGSTLGSAGFSGQITLEPLPEPGAVLSGLTALGGIAALYRYRETEHV